MIPRFSDRINKNNLFRLRMDNDIPESFFLSMEIEYYITIQETSLITKKVHSHSVFYSKDNIYNIRKSFTRFYPFINKTKYSLAQNWNKETKGKDLERYMNENELSYQDIHILYILKDVEQENQIGILNNSLISNINELIGKFQEIMTKIKVVEKTYGNYLKKILTEYNIKYKNDISDNDEQEKIRIFKFVTSQFAKTNLDIFIGNAKIFDNSVIKKFCQTIFNTNFYLENQHSEEYMLYHFQSM